LHYVKALGLLVEGRAQVSMNLTNFRETPLARVVEMVRREAERYAVGIHHTELVGLIPQDALTDAAVWYTQLDQFSPEQVLETRLYTAMQSNGGTGTPVGEVQPVPCEFIDQLAAATATPGGGSAAAYAAAMSAALVGMVAGLTIGKKKYASVEPEMYAIMTAAQSLRAEFVQAVEDDASSFEAVMGAMKLPKDTPEQQAARTAAIEMATLNAAHIPLHVAQKAVKVMDLAVRCVEVANINTITDAASGAAMAKAAITAAGYNVRVNVNNLPNPSTGQHFLEQLKTVEEKASQTEMRLQQIMIERGGIKS
jgi:glutamate formiminotransferase/formiminotetrahydrofolate cyclodeaminase